MTVDQALLQRSRTCELQTEEAKCGKAQKPKTVWSVQVVKSAGRVEKRAGKLVTPLGILCNGYNYHLHF